MKLIFTEPWGHIGFDLVFKVVNINQSPIVRVSFPSWCCPMAKANPCHQSSLTHAITHLL